MTNTDGAAASAPKNEGTYDVHEIKIDAGPVDWAAALASLDDAQVPAEGADVLIPPAAAPAAPVVKRHTKTHTKSHSKAAGRAPEASASPAPAPPAPVEETGGASKLSRYEQLCKAPSMSMKSEDLAVMDEFSDIMGNVNGALNKLKKFSTTHPYLVAPNILRMWEDNLQDTASVMMREFHAMRNGRKAKTYDKRCVCTECKSVSMVPLPGGLCDECRSRMSVGGGEY